MKIIIKSRYKSGLTAIFELRLRKIHFIFGKRDFENHNIIMKNEKMEKFNPSSEKRVKLNSGSETAEIMCINDSQRDVYFC